MWIERGQVRVEGRDAAGPLAVRVTHIFRRETGAWRIIHRHGDPITEIREAGSVQGQELDHAPQSVSHRA